METIPDLSPFDNLQERYERALQQAAELRQESDRLRAEARRKMRTMQEILCEETPGRS